MAPWPERLAVGPSWGRPNILFKEKEEKEEKEGSRAEAEGRPRPAGELGGFNYKLATNRLEISFQKSVILCGFFCTSVSALSKDSVLSMSIYHALKEPRVQLTRGQ